MSLSLSQIMELTVAENAVIYNTGMNLPFARFIETHKRGCSGCIRILLLGLLYHFRR
jgi:hypothetical protein